MNVASGVELTIGGVDASLPPYVPLFAAGIIEVVLGIAALAAGLAALLVTVRHATRHAFTVGAAQ
jgi:hypothetical protein